MESRLPLKDLKCEQALLGTIIQERDAIHQVRELLSPECFYDEFHRQIYQAVCTITDRGERADMLIVPSELKRMGVEFNIFDFAQVAACSTFDVCQYAARLHDLAVRRRFHQIGMYLEQSSLSETDDIADVTATVNEMMTEIFKSSRTSVSTLDECIMGVYSQIDLNLLEEKELTGTPTGFREFDKKSGGLQKSDLIIIAGDTSVGKTSLAVSVMRYAALSGARCAMYSMEMKKEQITARLMSVESGVASNEILYAKLSPLQIEWVDKGVAKLGGAGIFFDDRSTSGINTIIASIRYMKLKHGIDGAIVDYLQILNVNMKGMNKEQQMGDVARRLKNLAKELDIWIIVLSQLNRDSQNPQPSLARLRDSGQIAEAADVVMLIYRPEVYDRRYPAPFAQISTEGTALIDVAKGRNFGLLRFICGFDRKTTHFFDLDTVPLYESVEEDEVPF